MFQYDMGLDGKLGQRVAKISFSTVIMAIFITHFSISTSRFNLKALWINKRSIGDVERSRV